MTTGAAANNGGKLPPPVKDWPAIHARRERVAELRGQGKTIAEIARIEGVCPNTIANDLARMSDQGAIKTKRRLVVHGREKLLARAVSMIDNVLRDYEGYPELSGLLDFWKSYRVSLNNEGDE